MSQNTPLRNLTSANRFKKQAHRWMRSGSLGGTSGSGSMSQGCGMRCGPLLERCSPPSPLRRDGLEPAAINRSTHYFITCFGGIMDTRQPSARGCPPGAIR